MRNVYLISFLNCIIADYEIFEIGDESKKIAKAVPVKKPDPPSDPKMMALHNGSRVFVRRDDILKIFCDKPALYSVRLAVLVFGEETLKYSCMPDESDPKYVPLDEEVLDSIISMFSFTATFSFGCLFINF